MKRVSAVIVLYHPEINVIENIKTYLPQIERLYVVNNSERPLDPKISSFLLSDKIKVINNLENLGIAKALNQGAIIAIDEGFDYLLTMDQDSKFLDNFIDIMISILEKDSKIGILAPYIIHEKDPIKPQNDDCFDITVAMTSGCILKLEAFKEIGGFLEELFIDYVDNEYCLRLKTSGYKIKQINSIKLIHNLGETVPKRFFLKKTITTNHSPLRYYYRTRNRFFVYKKFKSKFFYYVKEDRNIFFKEMIKIILFESEKYRKFYMILLGFRDFRRNKFGKFIVM